MYVVIRPEAVESMFVCDEDRLPDLVTGCVIVKIDPALIDERGRPLLGIKESDHIDWN